MKTDPAKTSGTSPTTTIAELLKGAGTKPLTPRQHSTETIEMTPQLHAALIKLREANEDLIHSLSFDDICGVNNNLNARAAKAREDAEREICHALALPEHKKFYTPSLRVVDGAEGRANG
jgi:hypothetical protein